MIGRRIIGGDPSTILFLRGDSFNDESMYAAEKTITFGAGASIVDGKIRLTADTVSAWLYIENATRRFFANENWTLDWKEKSLGAANSGAAALLCPHDYATANFANRFNGGLIMAAYGTSYAMSAAGTAWTYTQIVHKDKVLNAETHWAIVKNGLNFKTYKNGVQFYNVNFTDNIYSHADQKNWNIGRNFAANGTWQSGYNADIWNFRLSNIARWTANFTPPV